MTDFKFKKGYSIPLQGETEKLFAGEVKSKLVAIKPGDFVGLKPKLLVDVGTEVKIGSPLFYSKRDERIKFTSPVCGVVKEIKRGERRFIEAVVIENNGKKQSEKFKISKKEIENLSRDEIIAVLLNSGLFPSFIQRPFGKIANPDDIPRDIFISSMESAPLSPDINLIIKDSEDDFQHGLDVLGKLTNGNVYLGIDGSRDDLSPAILNASGVKINRFIGPHPAGNVGVQIHNVSPIMGKHDLIWTCNVQSIIWIGKLFNTGKLSFKKNVAIAGSASLPEDRKYYEIISGASIGDFVGKSILSEEVRFISGNVLTGEKIDAEGFIGFFDNLITIIPEVVKPQFFGWIRTGLNKPGRSKTLLSSILKKGKAIEHKTGKSGGERAFVISGDYEKVLPMDIYPIFLLKSIYVEDIEEMEGLGIYEVIEEDFALCEYIDPSKNEIQAMIRKGLDLVEKEG